MTRGVFVAGTSSSSELNDCFDPPRARAYNSAAESLATATDTAVTFDSERWDVGAIHSTSVNTSRFTIPAGGQGYYTLGANVRFASNATGTRRLAFWVNGITTGTRIAHVLHPAVSGAPTVLQIAGEWRFAAGDYVELAAYQDSGGALNIENGPGYSPEMWCRWTAVY